jgi:hypothetical protein
MVAASITKAEATTQLGQIQMMFDQYHEKGDLTNELAHVRDATETYEREFLDRSSSGGGGGRPAGLKSFQDWVLLAFFGLYALLLVIMIVFVMRTSTKKLRAVATVLAGGTALGAMMMGMIVRLG